MTFVKLNEQGSFMHWLAKSSYEIYLIHPNMMCIALMWLGKGWMNVPVGDRNDSDFRLCD